ncbi:ABC transporter permease [Hyphomicrobiales bacterium]|nr:ABC transporter permease [Rhodobiaceae bacterium]MDB4831232.1 ABC transporter permease [Hyphomicrobiales bacterium]MBT5641141.1 ABC transporter permease [Rhodobiaceae bacterium]MBT6222420.1 ABC transporter permease [Rhodobiaceae bacterium]MDC0139490.1 ABC transporter permease [Hyphomicrobiales bacterium]
MFLVSFIGKITLGILSETGRSVIFLFNTLSNGFTRPFYFKAVFIQIIRIGYNSLPVIGLTAFFTGGALALQIYVGSSRFNAESMVASIVALGITRELGPVIAGLMLAGRVSASIAAEIATMRVTEQIDALITLSTNPFKYLIFPRVIAAIITLPILVFIADIIGIMGGYVVGTMSLGFVSESYIQNTINIIENKDFISGIVKAAIFGFIVAFMGCYNGYNSTGGAQGVGQATTRAVVSASIFILAANYLLTSLVFTQ